MPAALPIVVSVREPILSEPLAHGMSLPELHEMLDTPAPMPPHAWARLLNDQDMFDALAWKHSRGTDPRSLEYRGPDFFGSGFGTRCTEAEFVTWDGGPIDWACHAACMGWIEDWDDWSTDACRDDGAELVEWLFKVAGADDGHELYAWLDGAASAD